MKGRRCLVLNVMCTKTDDRDCGIVVVGWVGDGYVVEIGWFGIPPRWGLYALIATLRRALPYAERLEGFAQKMY